MTNRRCTLPAYLSFLSQVCCNAHACKSNSTGHLHIPCPGFDTSATTAILWRVRQKPFQHKMAYALLTGLRPGRGDGLQLCHVLSRGVLCSVISPGRTPKPADESMTAPCSERPAALPSHMCSVNEQCWSCDVQRCKAGCSVLIC